MINLSKYLKGTITIRELENMPNRYIQCIYKEFVNTLSKPDAEKAMAAEQLTEAIGG